MTAFRQFFPRTGRPLSRPARPVHLHLERLEERTVLSSARVVPLSQPIDGGTTFHRLQDALTVATSNGDVVTVSPGATADLDPVVVSSNGITITGDPNVPGSILPSYDIIVNASRVTLSRLNLGNVTIHADVFGDLITRSTVNTITVNGGISGTGNTVIDQNTITGSVSLLGIAGTPTLNLSVTNNTFDTLTPVSTGPIINVQDTTNAVIQNNTITGGGPVAQVGIEVTRGLNTLLANNTINLNGGDLNTVGIELQNPGFNPMTTVTVRNNAITTGQGRGLFISALSDLAMQALVQGNDFHNNAIGVYYLGSSTNAIATDLGGGNNSQGGSLGGNDFRGFPAQATSTNAAILMANVAKGAVLPAELNIFSDPTNAAATVTAPGAGAIDVSQPLNQNRAFIQTLYNDMLGRTGTLAELDTWVSTFTAAGKNGELTVVNTILHSDESLDRIIAQDYLNYLGRVAGSKELQYWLDQLHAGLTPEQMQAGFMSSAEFLANNNSDYIQGLYRTLFGRTASGTELAFWYAKLPTLGLSGVALQFTQSQENRDDLLTAFFHEFLHRAPSAGDMSYWSVQSGDLLTVEGKLIASGEYFVNG